MVYETIEKPRATGQTTRLADKYIQSLFRGGKIVVRDHYIYGEDRKANQILFDRIIRRLQLEHEGIKLDANRSKLTICILK